MSDDASTWWGKRWSDSYGASATEPPPEPEPELLPEEPTE